MILSAALYMIIQERERENMELAELGTLRNSAWTDGHDANICRERSDMTRGRETWGRGCQMVRWKKKRKKKWFIKRIDEKGDFDQREEK